MKFRFIYLVVAVMVFSLDCLGEGWQRYRRSYRAGSVHYQNNGPLNGQIQSGSRAASEVEGTSERATGVHGYGTGVRYDVYDGRRYIGSGNVGIEGGEAHIGQTFDTEVERSAENEEKTKAIAEALVGVAMIEQRAMWLQKHYEEGRITSYEMQYARRFIAAARSMIQGLIAARQAQVGQDAYYEGLQQALQSADDVAASVRAMYFDLRNIPWEHVQAYERFARYLRAKVIN